MPLDTRAVQVAEVAGSLNSGDVFVLLTPAKMLVCNKVGIHTIKIVLQNGYTYS